MRWHLSFIAAALAALALATAARPALADDRSLCGNAGSDPDERIAACSREAASGRWQGHDRAVMVFNRAVAKLVKGDRNAAIADYDEVIRLDPAYVEAFVRRGDVRKSQGDLDGAIADYNQAIGINPNYVNAYINRGIALNDKHDLDGALADDERAIRLDPHSVIAYINRGVVKKNKGDFDGAIADYNEAIRLGPKNTIAYGDRAFARKEKGDLDGAIADYDTVIQLDPKSAPTYFYRGVVRHGKGNNDGAIADYDAAIKLDQRYVAAYVERGIARQGKHDLDGAIADYSQAIKVNPKFAIGFGDRGNARFLKGDLDGAIADYSQAILLDPAYTAAYTNRGLSYEKKQDAERARADFNAALKAPEKYANGKWAHDTARQHLAARAPPSTPAPLDNAPPPPPVAGGGPALARIALVIGNSNYLTFPKLPNPRNDAEDIATSLKALGFDVLLGTDLKRADMEDIFIRFAKKARQANTALVYFAGHGLQHQGINYLAPVDAQLNDETDLRKFFNLQDVISDLQSAGQVRILIVDACRDNEAMKQLAGRLPATRSAAFAHGLAAVSGAEGTLIAFATQANRVAADGKGRHSPFAVSLLKNLPTPGLELRTLMTRVRSEVVTATGGAQRPEVWDSLVGEFEFKTAK